MFGPYNHHTISHIYSPLFVKDTPTQNSNHPQRRGGVRRSHLDLLRDGVGQDLQHLFEEHLKRLGAEEHSSGGVKRWTKMRFKRSLGFTWMSWDIMKKS